jgi:phosphinothricin acetyltransferase
MQIRDAVETDLRQILAIHNEVIANSTAIYAEDPVSYEDRRDWFNLRKRQGFPILVSEDGSGVTGYCSFGEFRAWPCYRYTIEHSVHVRADRRGQRIGRQLMDELIARATSLGKHVLIGGIDAENVASRALHTRLGFEEVAHFKQVGRKFGRWLDLVFMQKILEDG